MKCPQINDLNHVLIAYSFPYYDDGPDIYKRFLSSYWEFRLRGHSGPLGYVPEWVVDKMPWSVLWELDRQNKVVKPGPSDIAPNQEELIRATLEEARDVKAFDILKGWRNELYPIYGPIDPLKKVVSMERGGSPLFGINSYGVHMTVYVQTEEGMKIWVPRRVKNKQTYGGYLDNTVAGGLSTCEKPLECMIRESAEEASFSEDLVRSNAKACGTVSYIHIRDKRAGGETGLIQPESQYVYDMEIPANVVPKPNDNEVEEFYLWSVEEVQKALTEGQFKPNCALVLLDFFVRHGILNGENEPNFVEIVSRLHRRLPFPTS